MKRALRYAIMFAQGMNYLHLCSPPIIHRDLKPANLLLDFSDTLKVADFGLAKLRPDVKTKRKPPGAAGSGSGGDDDDVVCMTGETGSYRFMAPEVFRHEQYSEKVDVYSFALILYNMLSGHAPWPDKGGVVAVAGAALRGSRPEIPRHWDETMIALIQSCWVKKPPRCARRSPRSSTSSTLPPDHLQGVVRGVVQGRRARGRARARATGRGLRAGLRRLLTFASHSLVFCHFRSLIHYNRVSFTRSCDSLTKKHHGHRRTSMRIPPGRRARPGYYTAQEEFGRAAATAALRVVVVGSRRHGDGGTVPRCSPARADSRVSATLAGCI